ncbi:iron-sulfur cluster biosynthesis family protein [Agrilactobacillus fermenti]|uniref:iron-sulfur cluster biosynthesis family protein n=1 Tax=Agrilactobacillus fermenti TaxID=2586909 RepID=UPI001E5FDAE3|nr:iron-sulfur cluster biosynthesis family protein [Agrilactobacillus fermenti]MCD2255596.1 iron-sulfur cluster biosynthesis family protein [Agrilactobacillus fermenti]
MRVDFDENVVAKIKANWQDGDRLLLTFEDGVGPYSQHAMIHMQVQFSINIIGSDMSLDTYDQTIDSNLGPVYIKGYSADSLDEHMTVKYKKTYDTMQLSGDVGVIDDNVGFIDFTDPASIKKNPAR